MDIRPYHPSDLPALYRVCLRTGDSGRDATARYRDPDLLGHVYVGPYPTADPTLAWVAADDHGVAGYLVATDDTARFEDWTARHWWPALRAAHPLAADPGDALRDRDLIARLHADRPSADVPADAEQTVYRDFPAHLHIDLLPRAQRRGLGRRLIHTLADELRTRGVPGLHLGVDAANRGAVAFYAALGLTRAAATPWGWIMTLPLR